MSKKNINIPLEQSFEINKMVPKIMGRYQIKDENFAYELALTLYNYGIGNDKFNNWYYQGCFDLDEIVHHLITKKRMIQFKNHLSKPKRSLDILPEKAEVISFPKDKSLCAEAASFQAGATYQQTPKIKKRQISTQ